MAIDGIGKKVEKMFCPKCREKGIESELTTHYGIARCNTPGCDFVAPYRRDEQVAPGEFEWDRPQHTELGGKPT